MTNDDMFVQSCLFLTLQSINYQCFSGCWLTNYVTEAVVCSLIACLLLSTSVFHVSVFERVSVEYIVCIYKQICNNPNFTCAYNMTDANCETPYACASSLSSHWSSLMNYLDQHITELPSFQHMHASC